MRFIATIAFRNLFRHTRRNLLIGLSIVFSVGILFFVLSFSAGIEKQLIFNLISIESGALSVSPSQEMLKDRKDSTLLPLFNTGIERIKGFQGVQNVRQRVHATSFLYYNNDSERINLKGLKFENENGLFKSFRFLSDKTEPLKADGGIYISQGLAKKLELNQGDACSIMAQTVNGTLNLYDFYVAGIYTNISGWTNANVFTDLNLAQKLLNTSVPTDVLVDVAEPEKVDGQKTHFKEAFGRKLADSLYVKSYKDNLGVTHIVTNANKYGFLSIVSFILLMSFIAIVFLVLNNLMERNNEVGTLLAIGFKPLQIRLMFITETLLIGLFASGTAIIIFLTLILLISQKGIDLGESAAIVFGSSTVKPVVSLQNVLFSFFIGLMYPLLSAVFGTFRINRIEPVEALRVRIA